MKEKTLNPYLSKSFFIRGLQCHKALYLDRNHPELRDEISEAQEALFQGGAEVGLYAQNLFPGGVNIPYEGLSLQEQLTQTQDAIMSGVRSCNLTFLPGTVIEKPRDRTGCRA